ncbi:MAG: zinc-finger domain-containing protein, partial [Pseudomonadota bacterium]
MPKADSPAVPTNESKGPPPPEVIYVSETRIACDGGGGALGHPKVWYSLEDGRAECGYCDRLFLYDP